ncbi:retrovirus-related pol polyprotein from transposon TNT 1-94, partial [Tanacetum coccineum]
ICLGVDLEPDEWIKDSGCSKHMTSNRKLFSSYKAYNEGNVIFGSNLHGNIIGKGQICDNKCRVTFSEHDSEITKDGKVIGRCIRTKGLYVMNLGNKPKDKICLAMIDENSMLWHRRLGHVNMRLIQSLASKELVRNLPKLKFDQHFCDACKIRKQAHASHKAKNIVSTTRCLELLHMDLFGPSAVQSYGGNHYTLVIVDDYSRHFNNVNEAITDDSWIVAMQEELNQFIANDVWELVPQPRNMKIIGIKWVFRYKLNKNGIVSQNKARLVAQGYNQQEGIDYDETYALVLRLESIRILLAYACTLDFKLFQMDVKSAFLNGFINEEVYVAQPPRFINFEKPDHVYKLKKALYGLKQAPKAWYDRLKAFLIKHEYKMGMVDNTLFTKKRSSNLIIVQIYVDDIIFGSTCQDMCDEFAKIMHEEFEMSMMEMLKKFGLKESKPMKTPMSSDTKLIKDEEYESVDSTKYRGMIGTTHLGLWFPKGTGIETVVYADSDHARDYVDRKSTSSICTFMGCCLTSWFSKKQTALSISTTKVEYVSAGKACQQALWMKQALIDYDVRLDDVPIMCDSKGAIDLSKNPGTNFRTKHIKIRHHFLRDSVQKVFRDNVQKGHISIKKVSSVDNIADILTKPLKSESFNYLQGQVRRIRHEEEIDVLEYQVLTREIEPTLEPLEEIIRENIFCLGGNRDHVPVCLCYMLCYVVHSEKFNIAYFMAKRIEWVTKQKRLILPYGMLLTRLFKFVMNENQELKNESYVLYDRVMNPLTAQPERKTRKNFAMRRGRHSTSSSSAFGQPSSSHFNNDDDGNDEGTSCASTPSPIRYVNSQLFVNISSDEDVTITPSPTTTSSSPTPPNAPSKTTSTNQTSSSQENTSSSFKLKLQISPPSLNEPTSPHFLNPLLENISDVPPRPSNPQPLQSHPSLDITLSLSPITPFDHIHDTPSPPSPPQPQPPIMGHPLYYNYHDYHGSNCICFFHNRTLFLNLRDEMNIMFAHLEYLLTIAITSHFPPPP